MSFYERDVVYIALQNEPFELMLHVYIFSSSQHDWIKIWYFDLVSFYYYFVFFFWHTFDLNANHLRKATGLGSTSYGYTHRTHNGPT